MYPHEIQPDSARLQASRNRFVAGIKSGGVLLGQFPPTTDQPIPSLDSLDFRPGINDLEPEVFKVPYIPRYHDKTMFQSSRSNKTIGHSKRPAPHLAHFAK